MKIIVILALSLGAIPAFADSASALAQLQNSLSPSEIAQIKAVIQKTGTSDPTQIIGALATGVPQATSSKFIQLLNQNGVNDVPTSAAILSQLKSPTVAAGFLAAPSAGSDPLGLTAGLNAFLSAHPTAPMTMPANISPTLSAYLTKVTPGLDAATLAKVQDILKKTPATDGDVLGLAAGAIDAATIAQINSVIAQKGVGTGGPLMAANTPSLANVISQLKSVVDPATLAKIQTVLAQNNITNPAALVTQLQNSVDPATLAKIKQVITQNTTVANGANGTTITTNPTAIITQLSQVVSAADLAKIQAVLAQNKVTDPAALLTQLQGTLDAATLAKIKAALGTSSVSGTVAKSAPPPPPPPGKSEKHKKKIKTSSVDDETARADDSKLMEDVKNALKNGTPLTDEQRAYIRKMRQNANMAQDIQGGESTSSASNSNGHYHHWRDSGNQRAPASMDDSHSNNKKSNVSH